MGEKRVSYLQAKMGSHRSRNGNSALRVDLHGTVHRLSSSVGSRDSQAPSWGIPTQERYCVKAENVHPLT
jgi:hypothetical protein